jgi:putative nucleotidyltransferase with HDIG domain
MSDLPRKLKRYNDAVRSLAEAATHPELMQRILDVIDHVFGREAAAILLRDPPGDQLRIAAAHGYDSRVVETFRTPVGKGVAGKVAASGEPRLIRDVTREPGYIRGVTSAVSEMAVPLTVDGEVIGVLDVESSESAFGDEDMALLVAFGEQAAWAIRHLEATRVAKERARRLELINRAACALNTIHDPEELLTRILELASESLGFSHLAILVADRDRSHLVVRKALGREGVEGMRIPVDQGVTGGVFRSRKPEIVPDVSADPRYIPGGIEGAHSEMVAPLSLEGEVIGVLDAESETVEAFTPLALEVFSAFAAQVATALNNAQLHVDLADRALRMSQISRAGRALNTTLESDELVVEILDAASEALGLERVAVLLIDTKTQELAIHAARGYGDITGRRISVHEGVTGSVAISGEPALVDDVTTDKRYIKGTAGGASEMAVPLRVFGELIGVLDTESPKLAAFSKHDLELFAVFADHTAVAIHNARLFDGLAQANVRLEKNMLEMARLNRELEAYAKQIAEANASLASQVKQLTTLHRAGQAITSSLDLEETLDTILQMSADIVAGSASAIKLVDRETQEMRVMARAGKVLESDSLLTYDLPLKVGKRMIGVLELVRQANEHLGDAERRMLETLGSQAAIAIDNARLFENAQRIYYETLKSLAKALEARDDYTRGHSERVAALALAIAEDLDLGEDMRHLVYNSALLHDIGKIGVRDAILLKPQPLSDEETAVIRNHPSYGDTILRPLKFLSEVSEAVRHHHERWDGGGYPEELEREEIPLASRIISVADAYDAMTSHRPYRAPLSHDHAITQIRQESGAQLDPTVVESFLRVIERLPKDSMIFAGRVIPPEVRPEPES